MTMPLLAVMICACTPISVNCQLGRSSMAGGGALLSGVGGGLFASGALMIADAGIAEAEAQDALAGSVDIPAPTRSYVIGGIAAGLGVIMLVVG